MNTNLKYKNIYARNHNEASLKDTGSESVMSCTKLEFRIAERVRVRRVKKDKPFNR